MINAAAKEIETSDSSHAEVELPPSVMAALGVGYGTVQSLIPFGVGSLIPSPAPKSKAFETGRGNAQTAVGTFQLGVGLTASGGGAAGAPVSGGATALAVPAGLVAAATGAVNVVAGGVTSAHAASLPPEGAPASSASRAPKTGSARGAKPSSNAPRGKKDSPPTGKPQWWIKKSPTVQADLKASKQGYQVYMLKDSKGNVLYVGKSGGAGGLKPDSWEDRIRAHIKDVTKKDWIGEVDQISVTSQLTEMEAFAAEEDLISKHKVTSYNREPGEFTTRFPEGNLSANAQNAATKPTFNFQTDIVP
jgi:hypothetical protein